MGYFWQKIGDFWVNLSGSTGIMSFVNVPSGRGYRVQENVENTKALNFGNVTVPVSQIENRNSGHQ